MQVSTNGTGQLAKVAGEPAGQQQRGCVWSRWPLLSHAERVQQNLHWCFWDSPSTACAIFWQMLSLVYHKKCQVQLLDWTKITQHQFAAGEL